MRLRFMTLTSTIIAVLWTTGCRSSEYTWAYAEKLDGTILENEHCRQSLAEVPYKTDSTLSITQNGNRFTVLGRFESYRLIAFDSRDACTIALSTKRTNR
jgi:hypothetical protein